MRISQHALTRFANRANLSMEEAIPRLYRQVMNGITLTTDEVLQAYGILITGKDTSAILLSECDTGHHLLAIVRDNHVVTVMPASYDRTVRRPNRRGKQRVAYDNVIRTMADDCTYVRTAKSYLPCKITDGPLRDR
jgi:hypothetical protein